MTVTGSLKVSERSAYIRLMWRGRYGPLHSPDQDPFATGAAVRARLEVF